MFDKLDFILEKYEELSLKVSDPDIINNQKLWQKHIKEMGEMEPIVNKYREYKKAKEAVAEAKEMLDSGDEELRELAKMEIAEYEDQIPEMEEQLKILLLPKDPNDEKNVILEVRAGTGGEEAALFAQDLLRMYLRYAERRGWKAEIMDSNDTGIGGIKEASVLIKGKGAALLREKSTEILTSRFVVIVDESKIVKKLGTKDALPVEIVPFGWKQTQKRLLKFGEPVLRPSKEDP